MSCFHRGVWGVLHLCALLALASLTARATAQQEYASESKSWSFTAPQGWNPIGFAVIKELEAAGREDNPDKNYKYVAGFTRGGMNTFNYPYVLVNVTDATLGGLSWDEIERGVSIQKPVTKYERELQAMVSQFAWGQTTVDRDNGRTVSTMHLPGRKYGPVRGPVKATVYSYLGSRNIVQFEVYELESAPTAQTHVDALARTFKFSEGNAFVPTAGGRSRGSNEMEKTAAMILLGIVGIAVVIVVAAVFMSKAFKKA